MTDLIRRADAIEAVRVLRDTDGDIWGEALDALFALPSAEAPKPTGDLISRADAIEAVMAESRKVYTSEYANAERIIYEADAVEALSMLPSTELPKGDLIRRADAIDAVDRIKSTDNWQCAVIALLSALPSAEAVSRDAIMSAKFHPLPYTHITPTDADAESYKRGWNDALDAVVDNAPSAEAVQGWIPCSERLPSMRTEVIYSYDGIVSTGYMTDRDYTGEKTEEHWEDLEIGAYIEPIAWMPLPTPYKGGEK